MKQHNHHTESDPADSTDSDASTSPDDDGDDDDAGEHRSRLTPAPLLLYCTPPTPANRENPVGQHC